MRRIRFSEAEPDDPSLPIDWRYPALTIAAVFLNFSFCFNYGLALCFGSLAVIVGVLAFAATALTAFFFIGPALAAQASRLRIFELVERSFGSIPAVVLRGCAVVFLALWIARLVAVPALWALSYVPGRERPLIETYLIAAGVVVFLFLTGLQSLRTSARLAFFTNKLGIAILIAAFIRVHDGWAAVPAGFSGEGQPPAVQQIFYGLSLLAFYGAPLLLLAVEPAARSAGRRQIALCGLAGSALPIFGALTLSVVIGVATWRSRFYTPSLNPTVAMALFSGVARSAVPSRMFIAAITTFGAARFGVRSLLDAASVRALGRLKWLLIGCLVAAIAWLSLQPDAGALKGMSDITATCLVIAAAVVTADFVIGLRHLERVRAVDSIGVAAFALGLAVPLCLPGRYLWGFDNYWHIWLFPSYGAGFLVCLAGRALRNTHVAGRSYKRV